MLTPVLSAPAVTPPTVCRLVDAGHAPCIIWSSPYRRCLQTAAVIAKSCGVPRVYVHFGLSESSHSAAKCFTRASSKAPDFLLTGKAPMYLNAAEMETACAGVSVTVVSSSHTPDSASGGYRLRILTAFRDVVKDSHPAVVGNVLIVSHGEGVTALGSCLRPPAVIDTVDYCGYAVTDPDLTTLLLSHGLGLVDDAASYLTK